MVINNEFLSKCSEKTNVSDIYTAIFSDTRKQNGISPKGTQFSLQ